VTALTWSRMPFGLLSGDGQFRIEGPFDEPGFKGYKLLHGGEHVSTHRLLREAKEEAEALKAAERAEWP